MLTKNQIAAELEAKGLGRRVQINNILTGLAELAAEEIGRGEDFTVPGIAALKFGHVSARTKGEQYKKGETYTGFLGVETVAEADSKPRKAAVVFKAAPAAPIKRITPTRSPSSASATAFAKTKVGKAVARRLAK